MTERNTAIALHLAWHYKMLATGWPGMEGD